MSVQTRRAEKLLDEEDAIYRFATMYPAFVTAPVPVEILDELIDEASRGAHALTDTEDTPHGCLCILTSKNLDSIKHGSRKPMQPFESPFLGWTDDEVRTWYNNQHDQYEKHERPDFSYFTFAILDKETARHKTCRISYRDVEEEEGKKMITTDFYSSMYVRIPVEIVTLSWFEEVGGTQLSAGASRVYTRKCIEEEKREVAKKVKREDYISS